MDDQTFGDQSGSAAGAAARLKQEISEKADVRDRVTDFTRQAAYKIDASRGPAADKLEGTASDLHGQADHVASEWHNQTDRAASTVHSQADRIAGSAHSYADRVAGASHASADKAAGAAHSAANTLSATADYLRDNDLSAMFEDVQGFVKRYPGQSLAAAAVAGFLLARVLRSDD